MNTPLTKVETLSPEAEKHELLTLLGSSVGYEEFNAARKLYRDYLADPAEYKKTRLSTRVRLARSQLEKIVLSLNPYLTDSSVREYMGKLNGMITELDDILESLQLPE